MTFVGDDFTIDIDTDIDVSAATERRIYYKKPDGTQSFKVATAVEDTLRASFTGAENDQGGRWSFQGRVIIGGFTYKTDHTNIYITKTIVP